MRERIRDAYEAVRETTLEKSKMKRKLTSVLKKKVKLGEKIFSQFPNKSCSSTVQLPAVTKPNRACGSQYCKNTCVSEFPGFQSCPASKFPSSPNSSFLE